MKRRWIALLAGSLAMFVFMGIPAQACFAENGNSLFDNLRNLFQIPEPAVYDESVTYIEVFNSSSEEDTTVFIQNNWVMLTNIISRDLVKEREEEVSEKGNLRVQTDLWMYAMEQLGNQAFMDRLLMLRNSTFLLSRSILPLDRDKHLDDGNLFNSPIAHTEPIPDDAMWGLSFDADGGSRIVEWMTRSGEIHKVNCDICKADYGVSHKQIVSDFYDAQSNTETVVITYSDKKPEPIVVKASDKSKMVPPKIKNGEVTTAKSVRIPDIMIVAGAFSTKVQRES